MEVVELDQPRCVEMNKLMRKKDLVIFSLLIISVLFIAGCQETVGGPTSNTRTSDSQGIRYNLVSADNRDTTSVTLRSNLNGNCNPPIGAFANSENRCYRILGCMDISAQLTSNQGNGIRLNGENQHFLATPVYGEDASNCQATDAVTVPLYKIINVDLSGF